jgi:hypothetical protein
MKGDLVLEDSVVITVDVRQTNETVEIVGSCFDISFPILTAVAVYDRQGNINGYVRDGKFYKDAKAVFQKHFGTVVNG